MGSVHIKKCKNIKKKHAKIALEGSISVFLLKLNIVNIKMINKHDKSVKIVQNKHFYVFIEKKAKFECNNCINRNFSLSCFKNNKIVVITRICLVLCNKSPKSRILSKFPNF